MTQDIIKCVLLINNKGLVLSYIRKVQGYKNETSTWCKKLQGTRHKSVKLEKGNIKVLHDIPIYFARFIAIGHSSINNFIKTL